jgi:Beta-glucanase/Beta-glucan synthetase
MFTRHQRHSRWHPVLEFRRRTGRTILAASALVLLCHGAIANGAGDTGDELRLEDMQLSFSEEFAELDVSEWGPGTRWIAHTPWSGDFGGARFAAPEPGFPFSVKDDVLRIEARQDENGEWRSGLLASVDPEGKGFAQQYGYFEMRARLPAGGGVWPAFWLIGLDRSQHTAEIDVLEYYGDRPDTFSSAAHVWRRKGEDYSTGKRIEAFADADPGEFHTYGVKIDAEHIRVYFDRQLVWKTPTQPEHRQPMYVLLNLALVEEAERLKGTANPSYLFVDYVHVYRFE